jgi:GNAT superfamily N-acetyltransferase
MGDGDSRLEYRPAGRADVGALVDLRVEFMRIVKDRGLEDEALWRAELSDRFARDLGSGEFVAWVCLDGARLVAASGLACPADRARRAELGLGGGEGLVLNMFTLGPYRRRGIASELLRRSAEEARARGLTALRLQATDDGRPLYERAGFRGPGRDMVLDLRPAAGL